MTSSLFRSRKVARLVSAIEPEGREAFLHQALPVPALEAADPFLLVQESGPRVFDSEYSSPALAYRGFSLLTYVSEGSLEQNFETRTANAIGSGAVEAGGASLINLGSGAVLSETSAAGSLHCFRLWINSSATQKMLPLKSQFLREDELPSFAIPGMESRVRVIAGECFGRSSAMQFANTMIFDFEISPGEELVQRLPEGWNAIVYVARNSGIFGGAGGEEGTRVAQRELAAFSTTGEGIRFLNDSLAAPLRFLFAASLPLVEPVARYGGFVMNSQEEIQRAFADFK